MSIAIPASAWVTDWHGDVLGLVAIVLAVGYLWAARGGATPYVRRCAFVIVGCLLCFVIACGPISAYAPHVFWVRALEVTLLLYVVPLGLAAGIPVTVFGTRLSASRRSAGARLLRSRAARVLTYPLIGSGLLLITPWILFFTGWNVASMTDPALDVVTRLFLVGAGFVYFYTRIQADPVPRRYPQGLSLLITLVESLADGVLGIVVWLGPVLHAGYYTGVGFMDQDQLRLSQTIGAGMLWLLADLFGLPFLMILMFALRREDTVRQIREDAAADTNGVGGPDTSATGEAGGLWWESDPTIMDRYRR